MNKFLLTSIYALLLMAYSTAYAQDTYVISCVSAPAQSRWVPLIRKAYTRIGITPTFKQVPAERALSMANSGIADAELVRIPGIENTYTNLIPVPMALPPIEVVVFSRDKTINISRWSDLKNYRVGIVMGLKYAEQGTKGMDVITFNNPESMFRLLQKGRLDVAIYTRHRGLRILQNEGIKNIFPISPPLQEIPLRHYVHAHNITLVRKLANVLNQMKDTGEMEAIMQLGAPSTQ